MLRIVTFPQGLRSTERSKRPDIKQWEIILNQMELDVMKRVLPPVLGFVLVLGLLGEVARPEFGSATAVQPSPTFRQLSANVYVAMQDDETPAPDSPFLAEDLAADPAPPTTYVRRPACRAPAPWTIPQPGLLRNLGIKMGGWVQQGATFNADHTSFNGPVATNDWDDKYQLNQVWLFFDRPADTRGCGWALGGHVDMLYGTDWRFGINHGLEDKINTMGDQPYGMVIPQGYLEVAYNNLSVKLGHFAGILDYEVVPAIANPFYSHSYSYGYSVPQLVTGALANYKLSERFSIQGGFHRGWFMFDDMNHHYDVMGGAKWISPNGRTTVRYGVSVGSQDPLGAEDLFAQSLVVELKITDPLKYVFVHNSGVQNNAAALGGATGEWYGFNQYLLYTISPILQANARIEWFRDDDGLRVGGPATVMPPLHTYRSAGFAGEFTALTLGLNWRPDPNIVFRPELRYDWYNGRDAAVGGPRPFNDGADDEQFTFGMDLIFTY